MARSLLLALLALAVLSTPVAHGQVRVATWNVAGFRGDLTSIFAVIDELSLDDHTDAATPASIMVLQEVRNDDYQALLVGLDASWSSAIYTNTSEDGYGGAQACFYRADQLLELPDGHVDLYTGAGRRCDRWQFQLLGHNDPQVEFYVYSAHFKAGIGGSNEADRLTGANRILEDLAKLPSDTAAIVCGDFNIYDNAEPAYLALMGVLSDPQGIGSWAGASNAIKHSQSPRTISEDGLASGGMDDRFDFMLTTSTLAQADALSFIYGTQRSVGNDGNHYNQAINAGTNTYYPSDLPRSNALADDLHDASDHLPVLTDFYLPPVLGVSAGVGIGTVIEGAEVDVQVGVSNTAGIGAADLPWSVSQTGDQGTLEPGELAIIHVQVNVETPGPVDASISVDATGDWVQHAPFDVPLMGTVLSHASPSYAVDDAVMTQVIPLTLVAGSGVVTETISLWNFGWSSAQARLDIDAVTGGINGLTWPPDTLPQGIAGFPATLTFSFDTDAMSAGNLFCLYTLHASDEDLPGEGEFSLALSFPLTIQPGEPACPGDANGDGQTNIADLLVLIDLWGTADAAADLNEDGNVDIEDLLIMLGDYGC